MVTYVTDIHFTLGVTESAVGTGGFIQLDAEDRDLVEESVEGTKGAEETTEEAEDEDRADDKADGKDEFPGEERTQHAEHTLVDLVGKKTEGALNGTGGAYVFTEGGKGNIADAVKDGHDDYQENEKNVLEVRQDLGHTVLFDLGRLDLIE